MTILTLNHPILLGYMTSRDKICSKGNQENNQELDKLIKLLFSQETDQSLAYHNNLTNKLKTHCQIRLNSIANNLVTALKQLKSI